LQSERSIRVANSKSDVMVDRSAAMMIAVAGPTAQPPQPAPRNSFRRSPLTLRRMALRRIEYRLAA
jgi:hypothetical protein